MENILEMIKTAAQKVEVERETSDVRFTMNDDHNHAQAIGRNGQVIAEASFNGSAWEVTSTTKFSEVAHKLIVWADKRM
jgi:hypothetical protein